jgi:hypothetical protein
MCLIPQLIENSNTDESTAFLYMPDNLIDITVSKGCITVLRESIVSESVIMGARF